MKFPKEQLLLTSQIENLIKNQQFEQVFALRRQVISEWTNELSEPFGQIMMAGFILGDFQNTITFGQQLLTKNYESLEILYYLLLSCIGKQDIYLALSLIKNSRLLSKPDYADYHNWENANYTRILGIFTSQAFEQLTLIIMVFVLGLGRELSYGTNQDENYFVVRWFDLLNMLYEAGYPAKIMDELCGIAPILFKLQEN
jgi:hypothetical protein